MLSGTSNLLRLAALAALLVGMEGALAADPVRIRVMGLPLAVGPIQRDLERPFFEQFTERVGFAAQVDYTALEQTGIKEFDQLRVAKAGLFDVIALRLGPVSRDEPTILGLDLIGLNSSYEITQRVVEAYKGVVD